MSSKCSQAEFALPRRSALVVMASSCGKGDAEDAGGFNLTTQVQQCQREMI